MKRLFILVLIHLAFVSQAQDKNYTQILGVTGAWAPKINSVSAEYFRVWTAGKTKRIELGGGVRFTSFFASQQHFTSAPAALAADPSKVDTPFVGTTQTNSFNVAIHLGYKVSNKIGLGFKIDALGFSFGGKQTGEFGPNSNRQPVSAAPTAFNILLINNNDRGTLNSEFFIRYHLTDRWSVKAAYQHLFTEYTTDTKIQTSPEENDRFRIKTDMFNLGVALVFK
ncbi:MAG: hypothetical protein ACKOE6_17080 [Flammeovirgaceae bacterium]